MLKQHQILNADRSAAEVKNLFDLAISYASGVLLVRIWYT
jgi:hypothetical protein